MKEKKLALNRDKKGLDSKSKMSKDSTDLQMTIPPSIYKVQKKKGRRGGTREGTGPAKGFLGRSAKKVSKITIDEVIAILGSRLKWCNAKINLYEGERDVELKYLDNLSKIAGPLMQAFKLRGIEVKNDNDLAKIFEEIAKMKKEGKKAIKIYVSEE